MPTPLDQFPAQTQQRQDAQQSQQQTQEPQFQDQRTDPRDTSRHSPDRVMQFRDDARPMSETGDTSGTPPQTQDETGQMVPLSALKEERTKRQEFETRFNELNERLARVEQSPAARQPEPEVVLPDPIDEPEAFRNAVVAQARAEARSETLAMSVEMVRTAHQDYDEAEAAFVEAAKADPALQERFRASKHPGQFVYDHGKKALTAKKMQQDPQAYEADLTEKIIQRLRAEGVIQGGPQGGFHEPQRQQTQPDPQRPKFPSSIATQRAVAPRTNPGFSGPTPLTAFPGPAANQRRA